MRADRLLSLLMLLQTRGRLTAGALAELLEVSERTIYRDVDALSAAGIPIYGEPGPDGGYALLDRYRTQLTGLTEEEVRALFMLSVPAPLADLGLQASLRSALLKLSAALPETRRAEEQRVRQRFHLDTSWWHEGSQPLPTMQEVQQAVWHDRLLRLVFQHPVGLLLERLVEALGLVAKAGVWHLVYGYQGRVRVLPVADLLDAEMIDRPFNRVPGFDLVAFWDAWCARAERARSAYPVAVRVAPQYVPVLPRAFGVSPEDVGPPDEEGWAPVTLAFDSLETARDRLLSFAYVLEVIEPLALRATMLDFARQVVARYGGRA